MIAENLVQLADGMFFHGSTQLGVDQVKITHRRADRLAWIPTGRFRANIIGDWGAGKLGV
jgi:hypothetical protein